MPYIKEKKAGNPNIVEIGRVAREQKAKDKKEREERMSIIDAERLFEGPNIDISEKEPDDFTSDTWDASYDGNSPLEQSSSHFVYKDTATDAEQSPRVGNKRSIDDTRIIYADIGGMKIMSDTIYIVSDKKDESAPSGLRELGFSKIPFPDNHTWCSCKYDTRAAVYDTGFYRNSPSLLDIPSVERADELNRRLEYIMRPYQRVRNQSLDQNDFEFWDSFNVKNYTDKVYDTEDVVARFELYISLLSKELTPASEEGNPSYMDSFYIVENKTNAINYRKRRAVDKLDATAAFAAGINQRGQKRDAMVDILVYLGVINIVDAVDGGFMKAAFAEWVDRERTNIDRFIDIHARAKEDRRFAEILCCHKILKYLYQRNKLQMTVDSVTYKNIYVKTGDLKVAAMTICGDHDRREGEFNQLRIDFQQLMEATP